MIDHESTVFRRVREAVKALYPEAPVYSETNEYPAKFPCLVFEQTASSTYTPTIDSSGMENYATVLYTADAYSNLEVGAKSQAKGLINAADEAMNRMGFTRTVCTQTRNVDTRLYRVTARWEGVVSADGDVHTR